MVSRLSGVWSMVRETTRSNLRWSTRLQRGHRNLATPKAYIVSSIAVETGLSFPFCTDNANTLFLPGRNPRNNIYDFNKTPGLHPANSPTYSSIRRLLSPDSVQPYQGPAPPQSLPPPKAEYHPLHPVRTKEKLQRSAVLQSPHSNARFERMIYGCLNPHSLPNGILGIPAQALRRKVIASTTRCIDNPSRLE